MIEIINKMNKMFNIGIDFGGVLSIHDSKTTNTDGKEHKNTSINMPGGQEALEKLKQDGHNLYLISFCGKQRAIETRQSIKDNNVDHYFNEQYYVKSKIFKNDLCQYLGCHFMIDDNCDILDNVKKNNPDIVTIWFDGNKQDVTDHKVASNWDEVLTIIYSTDHFEAMKSKINVDKLKY